MQESDTGKVVQEFPFDIDLTQRIKILTEFEPVMDMHTNWNPWTPVRANQRIVHYEIAQRWLETPADQLLEAYRGELGK